MAPTLTKLARPGRPGPQRRDVLFGGVCLCCLPSLARAATEATGGTTGPEAPVLPFTTVEVAPGIHVRRGVDQDATADNDDAIANIGFIIGRESVAVTDPGGCLRDGERLRAAIRAATDLPIRYVVLSHVHPDHVFGAGAFIADKPVFVGHARLPAALAMRGSFYQRELDGILGSGLAGPVITPTMLVQDHAEVDLGGRVLVLTAHGPGHTDADLSVLDRRTGTLLAADLLFVGRVPALDGSLTGWLRELETLTKLGAKRAVPGHGPVSVDWPGAATDERRYLRTLLRETREAVGAGVPIEQAARTVGLGERGKWALFDDYNGRNVIEAYKEQEWE